MIGDIGDFQTMIAAAVEEQTATTNEMHRNVSEASQGSVRIAQSVDGVSANAGVTRNQIAESHDAAQDLAQRGADLERTIASYVV